MSYKTVVVSLSVAGALAAIGGGIYLAHAALTFSGASITGDSNSVIDASGTVSIGTSAATGITIGKSGVTTTFPGNVTIGNTVYPQSIDGVLYADQFAGADIGAKINAAYAALPATGGTIIVTAGNGGSFTTPIVFNAVNKGVLLECDPGVQLHYTVSSGIAITMDWGSNYGGNPQLDQINAGTIGCDLLGPGNIDSTGNKGTSIGIEMAVADGSQEATIERTHVHGFSTGVDFASITSLPYLTQMVDDDIEYNTIGVNLAASSENIQLDHSTVSGNATGLAITNSGEVHSFATSYDNNSTLAINCSNCDYSGDGDHFEDPGPTGSEQYLTMNGGAVTLVAPTMLAIQPNKTTSQFISVSGTTSLYMSGQIFNNYGSGTTVAQIVNISGSSATVTLGPSGVGNMSATALFNGTSTSVVQTYPLSTGNTIYTSPALLYTQSVQQTNANQAYFDAITIPERSLLTGIRFGNGQTVAGNVIVGLYNPAGTLVASSSVTAQSGTWTFQQVAFSSPYYANSGKYSLAIIGSTSTAYFGQMAGMSCTGATEGSFALPSSGITPPSGWGYCIPLSSY